MSALFFTIICSTSIALILKYNNTRGGNPLLLLSANYAVAATISFLLIYSNEESVFSLESLAFGALLALGFVFSFFAFAKAVGAAGAALATVSSRLSMIVPLILSMLIFREHPSRIQSAGIAAAMMTIVLFYFSLKNDGTRQLHFMDYLYLGGVLMGIGFNDFAMKVFQDWRPQAEKPFFMFVIFSGAFFISVLMVWLKKIPLDKNVILRGSILGIPNMFSTFFMLLALSLLPAIVVYPLTNIGIILFTAIGARLIWKERLNRYGKLALISGILAIALLSLPEF
ncbi:MAG: hypothetical protein E4H13_09000 [Calditrichales bacterium]|nr:MAG: hypothetical protein E4H13_09000 [Calditrichales bacterium]